MRDYFITGGTGFALSQLVRLLTKLQDTQKIVCLTRGGRQNLFEHHKVEYFQGDITTVEFPNHTFTDVIHGAAEANDLLIPDQPKYYYDVVEGSRRLFQWVERRRPERLLYVSSGAVQKGDTAYCRAKRLSEYLCPDYAKIARIYSLIGPGLPINGQYALGRFIGSALYGGKVQYYESGSVRSYLHVNDCAKWLLNILDRGARYIPYNVGSARAITVTELAKMVARIAKVEAEEVKRNDYHVTAQIYLPVLGPSYGVGCAETIKLEDAIEEIIQIYLGRGKET